MSVVQVLELLGVQWMQCAEPKCPALVAEGWIRVLQILQQSEYFGTLLLTIFGMAKAKRWFWHGQSKIGANVGVESERPKSTCSKNNR